MAQAPVDRVTEQLAAAARALVSVYWECCGIAQPHNSDAVLAVHTLVTVESLQCSLTMFAGLSEIQARQSNRT